MSTNKVKNFARFYALLRQMPGNPDKKELAWQFSGMRTESLRDMRPPEYEAMIAYMAEMVPPEPDEAQLKMLRSAILNRLQKHGVNTASWAAVNKFMCDPRIAGKPMYLLSIDEMQKLIPRLESILLKDKQRGQALDRLARLN